MDPTPNPTPDPAPSPAPAPAPVGDPPPAPKPPEGLPTHYWDDKTNAVRTDDVVKDFVGLHKFKSDYDARLAAAPEKPESYKPELPQDFAVPAGMKITFDEKDPRLVEARQIAHELKLDQPTFSKLLALDAKQKVADFNAALANIEAEQAKLGEKFPEREKALTSFVASALTGNAEQKAAKHAALQQVLTNAAAFEGFEDIINRIGGTKIPGLPGQDPPAPSPQSHAERIWPNGFSPTPQQKVG